MKKFSLTYMLLTTMLVTFAAIAVQAEYAKTAMLCEGHSVEVDSVTYTKGGSYVRQHTTQVQRDSLRKDSVWHDTVWVDTTYVDTFLVDSTWQDSVLIIEIPIERTQQNLSLCTGDTLKLHLGKLVINKQGTYYDTLQAVSGCDSIVTYRVNMLPDYHFTEIKEIGPEQIPYTWRGQTIQSAGTYYDRHETINGCDSVYELQLTIKCSDFHTDTIRISDKQTPYKWHNRSITESGTYLDKQTSIYGCDSSYELVVYVCPTYRIVQDTAICPKDAPYVWFGRTYSLPGTYSVDTMFRTTMGFDSIYHLNLTIWPETRVTQQITLCEGETQWFRGKEYSETGIFRDTLLNSHGCDSIIECVVNVLPRFFRSDTIRISDKETRKWHGQDITKSDTYLDKHQSINGCDSIYELVAYVYPTYDFTKDTAICLADTPYVWYGQTFHEPGFYSLDTVFHTTMGFDSIYRLNLTIRPTTLVTQRINLCEGETQWFRGVEYSQNGTYRDTLTDQYGCDSVLTVVVSVAQTYHVRDTITLCTNESYPDSIWHGQLVDHAGTYYDRQTTINGCDSTYELRVIRQPQFRHEETVVICQSEAPYIWAVDSVGYSELGTNTYERSYPSSTGCDSLYILHLTINETKEQTVQVQTCKGERVVYNGITYEGRTQIDTLHYSTIHGCDSVVYLHINAMDGFERFDTATVNEGERYTWSCDSVTYHLEGDYTYRQKTTQGCDSIMHLHLIVHKPYRDSIREDFCANDTLQSYYWRGRQFRESDTYQDIVWDSTHTLMDSVFTLTLNFYPFQHEYRYVDVCKGGTYKFNDTTFNYTDTTTTIVYDWKGHTIHGCDSVITLTVNFNQVFINRIDTICDGDTLIYYGDTITDEGIYRHILPNENGCDTIINEKITLLYNFTQTFADTVCEDQLIHRQPYLFKYSKDTANMRPMWGQWVDSIGHYVDSTYSNCDSTAFFTLHVMYRPVHCDTITLCQGDSAWIKWHTGESRFVKEPGYYDDTIPSYRETYAGQCDSIYRTLVYVKPSPRDTLTKHVSDKNLPYLWQNLTLTESGYYSDTAQMVHGGCDSITVLHLIVDTTYYFLDSMTICPPAYYGPGDSRNRPYLWEGHHRKGKSNYEIYYAGTYFDSIRTVNNVDSIYELRVRLFAEPQINDQTYELCSADSLHFADVYKVYTRDTLITQPGLYTDTLRTTEGCDSIINRLRVVRRMSYQKSMAVTISDKETYDWILKDSEGDHSQRGLNATGVYHASLKSVNGCDSIWTLYLTVCPTYDIPETDTICESQLPYKWVGHFNNKLIYGAGTYYDRCRTVAGYDSTYTLTLTVIPSYKTREVYTSCEGDSLHYLGKTYTKPGLYQDTLTTSQLCDSIIIIDFQWRDKYLTRKSASASKNHPYVWREGTIVKTLDVSGIYYDTLTSVLTGCDSIIELTLTIYQDQEFRLDTVVCQQDLPFSWRGYNLNETGIYYDSLQALGHADSVYILNLTVLPMAHSEQLLRVCEGESVYYNGKEYNQNGRDEVRFARTNGCDSIVTVIVQVMPTYLKHESGSTPDNRVYYWRGKPYTQTGVYYDSLKTSYGCDSVFELTLTVYPTFVFHEEETVCENTLPYFWHGKTYNVAGTYYDSLQSVHRADSVYILTLYVKDSVHVDHNYSLCQGEVLTINGKTYAKAGRYVDTLTCVNGCDSVIYINLQYLPKYLTRETAETNDKKPFWWHGRSYIQTGVYHDTLSAQNGCDSIIELALMVYKSYEFNEADVVCANELPYIWHNKTYNASGTYYDSLQSVHRADSVYILKLTVLDSIHVAWNVSYCQGESFEFNGQRYDHAGQYVQTLTRANGCDSVIYINLQYRPKYVMHETAETNSKTPYYWAQTGKYYKNPGVYYDTLQSQNGCDSLIELTLTLYSDQRSDIEYTVCESELPFLWHGKPYMVSGSYTDTIRIAHQSDSICHMTLSILDSIHTTEYHTFCQGEVFDFNGHRYDQSGRYTETLTRANGCDSVITLVLRYLPMSVLHISAQTDDKHAYHWNETNKDYSHSGIYYSDTLKAANGCDSLVELTLTVYPTYWKDTSITICQSELPYTVFGRVYQTGGDYYDTLQTVMMYDSIYHIYLNVTAPKYSQIYKLLCEGDVFSYNGHSYDKPGQYTDIIRSTSGCDSIITIHLSQVVAETHVKTDTICDGGTYDWRGKTLHSAGVYQDTVRTKNLNTEGQYCDSIYYQLNLNVLPAFKRDTMVLLCSEDLPFIFGTHSYSESGTYVDTMHAVTGCDSVWTIHLTIYPIQHFDMDTVLCESDVLVIGGRTIDKDGFYTDTVSSGHGCGTIYTYNVHFLRTQHYNTSAATSTNRPYLWHGRSLTTAGIYMDTVRSANGLCDSIINTLTLTVYPSYRFDTTATVCSNDLPFQWRGKTYMPEMHWRTEPTLLDTVIYDTMQTVHHFDSIFALTLHVQPAYYAEQVIDLCQNSGSYNFRGKDYSKQGVYYDTIPAISGCDSLLKITVRVHPTYNRTDTVHISDTMTYNLGGRILNETGHYEAQLRTVSGCDSIVNLYLFVHPSYHFHDTLSAQCEGDTIKWQDKVITQSGDYVKKYLTVNGYDSVYNLHAVFHRSYFMIENYNISAGSSTTLHGIDISKPGVYWDSLHTVYGCDSVYKIVVNSPRSFIQTYSDTICQDEPYWFFNRWLTKTGQHTYTSGDSSITVNLYVIPTVYGPTRHVVVAPHEVPNYFYDGHYYDSTGLYHDTLTSFVTGCDSVVTTDFVVSQHVSDWDQITICSGSYLAICGDTISTGGEYTFVVRRPTGELDSLYNVIVYVVPAFEVDVYRSTCANEMPYNFNGTLLYRKGLTDVRYKSADGCDSIYHVYLTVHPSYDSLLYTAVVPDYKGFYWNRTKKYYYQSDTLRDKYSSVYGCDSTFMVRLIVVPTVLDTSDVLICTNGSYVWKYQGRDSVVTEKGFYNDTIWNAASRTSIIRTLHLTVTPPTHLDSIVTPTSICGDDQSFAIQFYTSNTVPDSYSIDFEQKANAQGLKDISDEPLGVASGIITIPLPVSSQPIYTDQDGISHYQYIRPDHYKASIMLHNYACDSTVRGDEVAFEFEVNYPSWIIQQKWSNVLAPLCADSNGGNDFSSYQWMIYDKSDQLLYQNSNPYYYTGSANTPLPSGGYAILSARRRGEDYVLTTCPMYFKDYVHKLGGSPRLSATRIPRSMPQVTILSDEPGSYVIYTPTGERIASGQFSDENSQLRLPAVTGCYLVSLTTSSGVHVTEKVIVY